MSLLAFETQVYFEAVEENRRNGRGVILSWDVESGEETRVRHARAGLQKGLGVEVEVEVESGFGR